MIPIKKFIIWISLYLIFLEIFLRLGGWISIWERDFRNLYNKGDYKIICIGDSYTGTARYPEDLQEILNKQQNIIHFVVLNEGIGGQTLDDALKDLPELLDKEKPNMVISMLGMDFQNTKGDYFQINANKSPMLWKKPAVLRLMQFLGEQVREGLSSIKQEMILQYLKYSPNHYLLWKHVAEYHIIKRDFASCFDMLWQGIKRSPDSEMEWFYIALEQSYAATNKEDQLLFLYEYVSTRLPNNAWAYKNIIHYYMQRKNINLAKKWCMIEMKKNWQGACSNLADLFISTGDVSSAKTILEKALEKYPDDIAESTKLAEIGLHNHEISQAQIILERSLLGKDSNVRTNELLSALNIDSKTKAYACQVLFKIYESSHKLEKAAILKSKLGAINQRWNESYEKIFETLQKRGIPLVAVQYPSCKVEDLKESFLDPQKLYFVDNELTFKQGIAKRGYFYFFNDRFGVVNGHLTSNGAWLLANNISGMVLNILKINQ